MLVSYGLDIGNKSFAWCRIDQYGVSNHSTTNHKAQNKFSKLKKALDLDLKNGNSIAIGVDAPMWFVDDFKPRFKEETANHEWYNRSGAAATVMSWVYLTQILCLISAYSNYIATLNIKKLAPPTTSGIVYLYECFMTSHYKISTQYPSLKGISRDLVDAFAVAAASWITHTQQQPKSNIPLYNSVTLTTPRIISPSYNGTCYSIWHAMGHAVGLQVSGGPQSHCDVFCY
ncbi:hypothetical protein ACOJUR_15310 [Alicyclobacillus tolerans]|uniref:hypothetical protein n=1 Tax=Alicyclobacillus tolerans TaxID=90970 RepID=UPI003B78D135